MLNKAEAECTGKEWLVIKQAYQHIFGSSDLTDLLFCQGAIHTYKHTWTHCIKIIVQMAFYLPAFTRHPTNNE